MATYQELIAQKTALEKQAADLEAKIATARHAERSAVLAQIKGLMQEHGVTLAELGGGSKGAKGGAGSPRAAQSKNAGRKVAAKYRNAATGDTWSGRGLQPNWLKAALASGRKIEDFAV